jgi:hypothetical protein
MTRNFVFKQKYKIHCRMFRKKRKNKTGEGHLTDGDETVDVGAAVERIEGDDVSTLSFRLHLDLVIVFLDKQRICSRERQ